MSIVSDTIFLIFAFLERVWGVIQNCHSWDKQTIEPHTLLESSWGRRNKLTQQKGVWSLLLPGISLGIVTSNHLGELSVMQTFLTFF